MKMHVQLLFNEVDDDWGVVSEKEIQFSNELGYV
jgi:hypothetical protein